MRGEFHLYLSILIVLPTWYIAYMFNPHSLYRDGFVLILFGVALGSLLPDIDASDAKVFHGLWSPVGRFSKRFFYRPLTRLLGTRSDLFRDEHRGFLHSLVGCLLVSAFFLPISITLQLPIWLFGMLLNTQWAFWWFWIGIPIGFLLHLAEDSFTQYGVRWFFPQGDPTLSTTRTNRGSEVVLALLMSLVYGPLTLVMYILPSSPIVILSTFVGSMILLLIFHRINPRISRIGDKLERPKLVADYLTLRGGVRIESDDSGIATLSVEDKKEHYIAIVYGLDSKWGLDRDWLRNTIEARKLLSGDVIEVQTIENRSKNRTYYVVKNELFHPFMKWLDF